MRAIEGGALRFARRAGRGVEARVQGGVRVARELRAEGAPATVRLAARVLWRRAREAAAADGSNDDDDDEMIEDGVAAAAALGLGRGYDAVDALGDHWERLPDSRKASLAHAALLATAFHAGTLGPGSTTPTDPDPNPNPNPNAADPRLVARLLAKISCNAHTVCDEELNAIGVGVYPAAAMVNHGDAPTAAQSFKGKKIVLRATRDLKRGDEVTMAYVELLATRQERRAALHAGYNFDIDGTEMATYCPHASPDRVEACEGMPHMRNTRRTRLPGGAVLVDHGEGSDSPPWRTGHADAYLCAVEASRKSGVGFFTGASRWSRDRLGTGTTGTGTTGTKSRHPTGTTMRWTTPGVSAACAGPAASVGRSPRRRSERSRRSRPTFVRGRRRRRGGGAFAISRGSRYTCGAPWAAPTGSTRRCASPSARLSSPSPSRYLATEGTKFGGVETALKPLARISDLMNGDDAACALGPIHLLRVRVLDAMQRAAVTAGDFESARDARARGAHPAYRLSYPPCHPPLGLHLALIAKIEAHLVDLNAAVQFAREAISCLNVSHGRNSDVVRMMETLLGESEAELRYNEYNRSGGNEDAETGEGYLEAYE